MNIPKKKTEKEKMLTGEIYDCGDKELITRWHKAKDLTRQYNQAPTDNPELLDKILTGLLGSRGKNVWIAAPIYVDYGENIHIGNNCEINLNCTFLDCNTITIGDNALIGPNVQIFTVFHPLKASERFGTSSGTDFPFCKSQTAPVRIGNNVWIGGGSILLPNVVIGDNTVIGAGSVVTKSIPTNSLAVGNPCRVIRQI